jgi:hypothetical protein
MSRRKGTVEVRRRKAALFQGNWERTMLMGSSIILSARKNGKGNFIVAFSGTLPFHINKSQRRYFRTLGEADAFIKEVVREDAIKAAIRALGV